MHHFVCLKKPYISEMCCKELGSCKPTKDGGMMEGSSSEALPSMSAMAWEACCQVPPWYTVSAILLV